MLSSCTLIVTIADSLFLILKEHCHRTYGVSTFLEEEKSWSKYFLLVDTSFLDLNCHICGYLN